MIIFLHLFFFPALAFCQLGSLFGLGPQSSGMGSVSLIQGAPSSYQVLSAPASLGFLRAVYVGVGAVYFDPRIKPYGTLVLNSSGSQGSFRSSGVLPGGASVLSVAFPIGKERPLTIGTSVFLPFSSLIRVSSSPVNYPFYPLYNDISRNFFFVVGLGYELFDGLAFGVNVRSTTKSTTAYTLRSDNTVNFSANATEARGESRLSFSAVYDNAKRNPDRPFSVGAMYRAKAGLQTKISADVTAFVPIQGELTSLPSYSPAEWVLMATTKLGSDWIVSLDGAWVQWSPYVSPYGTGNINTYVISGDTKGARFKDIPVIRSGLQYRRSSSGSWIKSYSGRIGYLFHPSPVPDQTEDSNFVDNDRHGFTFGMGISVKNPWGDNDFIDLDFFSQYNWLARRDVKKISPLNVGAPGYTTGGKILLYGAGATLKF